MQGQVLAKFFARSHALIGDMMLRKVFLTLFGLFIAAQAVGIFAWGAYLHSRAQVETISAQLPSDMLIDSKGQLWVQPWAATYSDDFKWEVYQDGKLTQTFDIKSEPNFPTRIWTGADGNLYGTLGTQNPGIRVVTFDGSSWNTLIEFHRQYPPSVHAFAAGSPEDIWIGGNSELIHYNGSDWQTFTPENSPLPNADVNALFLDSQKRLWVGTNAGIAMVQNGQFQPLTNSAPSKEYIFSFAEDKNGVIWAGSEENLYSFNGAEWSAYNSKNLKLKGFRIQDIEVDSSNRVWALSLGGDVSVLDGVKTKYLFGKPGNAITNIEIGPDDSLYLMQTKDVVRISANPPLVSLMTLKFLWLLNNGVFVYLSVFLVIAWIAIALSSWGIGLGLALTGALFGAIEIFSLFDINAVPSGYFNPGFALTIFTFIGGLAGYFLKQRGVKRADIIGSGIGCLLGGILLSCAGLILLWALMSVS